jgi:hypothetical protein
LGGAWPANLQDVAREVSRAGADIGY